VKKAKKAELRGNQMKGKEGKSPLGGRNRSNLENRILKER